MFITELFKETSLTNEDPSVTNLIATESNEMSDIITAKEIANRVQRDPTARQEYFDYLAHLRSKHGKDYSTSVHQQATTFANHKD